MSTKKIVFLDGNTFPPHLKFARPKIAHEWIQYPFTQARDVAERIRQAEVVVTNKVKLAAAEIIAAKKLELIILTATGFDHVDINVARERGIAVCNAVDYGSPSIAEHALMLMLMLARNGLRYHKAIEKEEWQKSSAFCIFNYPITELYGKTLVVFGMGNVGRHLKKMAESFSMTVLAAGRKNADEEILKEGYIPFIEGLRRADFISLHLPLNAETENLITAKELKQMKPSAYLVNVARGKIVNELDIALALENKIIAGAAFDVLSNEPPNVKNEEHPLLALVGQEKINLVLTPHVAWAGDKSLSTITKQCAENVDAFYNQKHIRRID